MLLALSIRDIVLIHSLSIDFEGGLGILTGETGAGKSILLDALSLALGRRGDAGLVRAGTKQGAVTATFKPGKDHPVFSLLQDQGLAVEPEIMVRRVITADGRSKAFINDEPVTVGFLRRVGEALVEVHGQHDDRGLLNPKGHRALLDAFGVHGKLLADCEKNYQAWKAAKKELKKLKKSLAQKKAEEDFDRHALEEIAALDPKTGEEEQLAEQRTLMMQGEKSAGQIDDIKALLSGDEPVDSRIRSALRRLERLPEELKEHLKPTLEALEAAASGAEEGMLQLEKTSQILEGDTGKLESTEERLFELRALARKHKCQVSDLPALGLALQVKLADLEAGGETLHELEKDVAVKREKFEKAAGLLSKARHTAAAKLDKGVVRELKPLKLEKARFRSVLKPLEVEDWGPEGAERVEFEVSTNPGAPFGALLRIASGGELARFILALKVVLAEAGSAPTLIFDEVDRGVGGAVADAVGERLAALAETSQVLVVTHSPQVAARAASHWQIGKKHVNGDTTTIVKKLDAKTRQEEIARMLSGAEVTDKARAAAESLIEAGSS